MRERAGGWPRHRSISLVPNHPLAYLSAPLLQIDARVAAAPRLQTCQLGRQSLIPPTWTLLRCRTFGRNAQALLRYSSICGGLTWSYPSGPIVDEQPFESSNFTSVSTSLRSLVHYLVGESRTPLASSRLRSLLDQRQQSNTQTEAQIEARTPTLRSGEGEWDGVGRYRTLLVESWQTAVWTTAVRIVLSDPGVLATPVGSQDVGRLCLLSAGSEPGPTGGRVLCISCLIVLLDLRGRWTCCSCRETY